MFQINGPLQAALIEREKIWYELTGYEIQLIFVVEKIRTTQEKM